MADNLPAKVQTEIFEAFDAGSPMQRLLGATLDRMGGIDFVEVWAEENPGDFMRLLMATCPQQNSGHSGNTINLNMHPSLAPGPLDGGQTYEND